jgi:dihydropteroate synthase
MEYLVFENSASSCEILGTKKKNPFFSMGFGSFFKSPQNLKLQQRPPEDLKVLLLGSSRHQLLFEMAPGDPPICNFYLKKW